MGSPSRLSHFSAITKYTSGVTVAVAEYFFGPVGIRIDYSTQLVSCDGTVTHILYYCKYDFWERPDNLMYDSDTTAVAVRA